MVETLKSDAQQTAALPEDHPKIKPRKTGILLLNLGTPDATDYWSMRRYLSEFLSDRRVIDYSPFFWQPLLQLIILSKRPKSSGKAYASIWNRELDESPLRTITREQCDKIRSIVQESCPDLYVDWAMRYGNPTTQSVLEKMVANGCDRIIAFALYPQYSAPTTASAYDHVFRALMKMKWQPSIHTVGPYHDHEVYINLLVEKIRSHLSGLDWKPQKILMSFHGVPKRYLLEGDPYHCMCQKTRRLVAEKLEPDGLDVMTVFQSRFGSEEWLKPYLDETLENLPSQGIKNIALISPAFAADCVETLEEIDQEGREEFLQAGGEKFSYIPCLNSDDAHMDFLAQLVIQEGAGWLK